MSVEHVEVIVEEPSMEAALRALLPRILGDITFEVYPHQCKDELLMRLPERLRAYASWLPKTWRIVVVVDCDDDSCIKLKRRLDAIAVEAGLVTKSSPGRGGYAVVNRIAIEELEAWYFGDWDAVRAAYPRVAPTIPAQARYRNPDGIAGGTWEAFERVLRDAGYFKTGLRKIEAARSIGQHIAPERNTSRSFQALRIALNEMASPPR
ncbi:DUF4276 family protein [Myxococcus sp. AM001]|nr:DUF4276 family protein [Myxococcus sp. AM001]